MHKKVQTEKELMQEFRKKFTEEPSAEIRRQIINKYMIIARKRDFPALMDDLNVALAVNDQWSSSADNAS